MITWCWFDLNIYFKGCVCEKEREGVSFSIKWAPKYAHAFELCMSIVCVRVCAHSAPSSCMLQNMACAQACVFGERGAMREGGKERDKRERFESSNVKRLCADELVHVVSGGFFAVLRLFTLPQDSSWVPADVAAPTATSGFPGCSTSEVMYGILPFLQFHVSTSKESESDKLRMCNG